MQAGQRRSLARYMEVKAVRENWGTCGSAGRIRDVNVGTSMLAWSQARDSRAAHVSTVTLHQANGLSAGGLNKAGAVA